MGMLEELASLREDPVVIIDRQDELVTFANAAASRILQISTGDDITKLTGLFESVANPDKDYVRNKYVLGAHRSATTNVEFRLNDIGGKEIFLNCDVFLVRDKKFAFVIARDVTLQKQHEQYLVEYGTRKNTLLDTVVHQLNGSMMLVNNLALRAGTMNVTRDQDALDEFVSLVHTTSKHAIEMIENLLKKEHTESPGIHVQFARTDVVKIVSYIFDEMKRSDGPKSILLETSAPEIFVNTDDIKLLQIVNNFASNAQKFTREGDEIKISVRETNTSVVIAVVDTGIGIPQSVQPFIFEKHGPACRTGLNGEKSVGLGLSICHHLSVLLDGKIWFESKEGEGSAFYLEIPKG
jgi:two-component system sensor histidine kinase VicK